MTKFIVTTPGNNGGGTYYLRATVWTSERTRATEYNTRADAEAARDRSAKFNPKAAKRSTVLEV